MQRDWVETSGHLAAAALFVFVGVCAWKGGRPAVGAALLVSGALLVPFALGARRAECPRCGRGLSFTDFAWCPRCLEYYAVDGASLNPVPDRTIAGSPRFVAQFKRLKAPDEWEWPEDAHDEGVSFGSEPGEDEPPRSGVSFRSYRRWKLFQEANRRMPDE